MGNFPLADSIEPPLPVRLPVRSVVPVSMFDARTGGGAPGNDDLFAARAPAMATGDRVKVAEAMHRLDQIHRSEAGAKAGRGGNDHRFSARHAPAGHECRPAPGCTGAYILRPDPPIG